MGGRITKTYHCEDVGNVVHHNVYACQLGPDLNKNTYLSTIDHVWLEQLGIDNICVIAFKFDHFTDFRNLLDNEWRVLIATSMDYKCFISIDSGEYESLHTKSKHVNGFIPASLLGEPPRRSWEEDHGGIENDSWKNLKNPWESECSSTFNKGCSITDIEHYENSPYDSPWHC